jgi:uncharacterized protein YpiB (UPF0302 family)
MCKSFDDILNEASETVFNNFKSSIASHTSFSDEELEKLLKKNPLDSETLKTTTEILDDATLSNNKKAELLQKIGKGGKIIVEIIKKLV